MAASYSEYVSRMTLRNPSLGALSLFLSHQPRSVHNSTIQYAQIDQNNQLGPSHSTNASDLISHLDSRLDKSILAVVENIHPEDIEVLGSALGINPFFFCGHIASSYRDIEKSALPPLLALPPSQIASPEFLNIHYQKVLDLGDASDLGQAPYDDFTLLSNISRSVRRLPALSGRSIGLLRGCTSVIKCNLVGDLWICLILVDPASDMISHASSDRHGALGSRISQVPRRIPIESTRDLPSFTEFQMSEETNSDLRYLTPSEDVLSLYHSNLPPGWNSGKPSILSLAYHPIQSINREWMLYGSLMSRYIKYYEYSFPTVSTRLEHFETNDILDLHRWRRRSKQTLHKLQMIRLFIEYWRAKEINSGTQSENSKLNADSSTWDLLLMDINHLQDQIDQHSRSLEALNPIMTSLVQLIDSHKSIAQAEDVRRLTYIAIAFIPLSYITGIFSMSDPYSPGGKYFWVYWVTAVPIAAFIMGFLVLENKLPNLSQFYKRVKAKGRDYMV